jgi:hypothetical protein
MESSPVADSRNAERRSNDRNSNGIVGGNSSPMSKEANSYSSAPMSTGAGRGDTEQSAPYQTILQEKMELEAQIVRLQGLIASIRSPNNHPANHKPIDVSPSTGSSAAAAVSSSRNARGGGDGATVATALKDDREEWEKKQDPVPAPLPSNALSANPSPKPPPGHMATLRALQDANVAAEKEVALYRRKCEELEEALTAASNAIGGATIATKQDANTERLKVPR